MTFTIYSWYAVTSQGYFFARPSFLGPAFTCVGLGLLIFPSYRQERLARGEDISRLKGVCLLTTRWWIILIISIVAGLLNTFLIIRE